MPRQRQRLPPRRRATARAHDDGDGDVSRVGGRVDFEGGGGSASAVGEGAADHFWGVCWGVWLVGCWLVLVGVGWKLSVCVSCWLLSESDASCLR
jgi:hypothetical protein